MACGVERWRAVVNTVMRTVLSGEFRRIWRQQDCLVLNQYSPLLTV
jgi:hypothetical protein